MAGDDGSAAVAYWASARVGGVTFGYAAVLWRCTTGRVSQRSVLSAGPEPDARDGRIRWRHEGLGLSGSWRSIDPGSFRTLLDGPGGSLHWNCVAPRAEATVAGDDGTVSGLGYAERLETTVPPWRLPIDDLRWGRCLTRGHGVVWIDWKGPRPLSLVLLDGREVEPVEVSDGRVAWRGGAVGLGESAVLRDGPLGPVLLSRIPGLDRVVPTSILRTHETKWLSIGTLRPGDGRPGTGRAIHELVRFRGGER